MIERATKRCIYPGCTRPVTRALWMTDRMWRATSFCATCRGSTEQDIRRIDPRRTARP